MDNLLPPDLAQRVTNELESMGVEIQRNAKYVYHTTLFIFFNFFFLFQCRFD